jgi:hypothetical protein
MITWRMKNKPGKMSGRQVQTQENITLNNSIVDSPCSFGNFAELVILIYILYEIL